MHWGFDAPHNLFPEQESSIFRQEAKISMQSGVLAVMKPQINSRELSLDHLSGTDIRESP